jgi:hypothetical protein
MNKEVKDEKKNRTSRIYKIFEEIGLDPHTYVCCGSDGYSRIEGHWINNIGINVFNMYFHSNAFPDFKKKCPCGMKIMENCYVTTPNYDYSNIIAIGNCCYENFIDNKVTHCLMCNEPHTNGIKKNAGLCDDCKVVRKAKLLKIGKEMAMLLKEHESSLNDIVKMQQKKYINICYLQDKSIQKVIFYDKLKKEGLLEDYLVEEKRKELIKKSNNLLDEYYDILRNNLDELNNRYKIRFNKFTVFSKFVNLKEPKKYLKYIENEYKIACIYIDHKHVLTINLITLKQTRNSPNLIRYR